MKERYVSYDWSENAKYMDEMHDADIRDALHDLRPDAPEEAVAAFRKKHYGGEFMELDATLDAFDDFVKKMQA